jgi:hypothetical protein
MGGTKWIHAPGDDMFRPLERVVDATGGLAVPHIKMEKPVDASLLA